MNDNELENLLKKSFKEDNDVFPFEDKVDNLIGNMYKKKKKRKMLFIIPILLISTTAFAIAYNVFNISSVGLNDRGIELAAKNGYIQHLDMPMQTYNNLGIKINDFLMDDINLDLSFEFKLDNFNIKNIEDINLLNICIYDENNNILVKVNNLHNPNPDTNNLNANDLKMINSGQGYSKVQITSDNTFKNTYFLHSANFPKSKKIYVEFNSVLLHCKNKGKYEDTYIDGEWKFEIDVPESMINRENITYKCISNNNTEDVGIENMRLTNTGLIFETIIDERDWKQITLIVDNVKYKANDMGPINRIDENKSRDGYYCVITKYDAPNEIKVKVTNKTKTLDEELIFVRDN